MAENCCAVYVGLAHLALKVIATAKKDSCAIAAGIPVSEVCGRPAVVLHNRPCVLQCVRRRP